MEIKLNWLLLLLLDRNKMMFENNWILGGQREIPCV
jgi:hypothetical protein